MKRTNIGLLMGWLDALRRDDRKTLLESLEPEVVWQGLKPDWVCRGPEAVVDVFSQHRDAGREVESLELIGAEGHAILHARGPGVREIEIELEDGIYNVFAISDGSVTRIDDFADRAAAFTAAGLEERPPSGRRPR
jgi:ketosteroid isomerase-like protein